MSWSDRALAIESLGMLAAARLLVKTRGNKLVSRMGGTRVDDEAEPSGPPPVARTVQDGTGARVGARVGAMVERASRATWWRSMCLEKALAGKWMLRRRGVSSTMYVGMARQGGEFVAHAWLVAEGQTLTGAAKTTYATLAAFREPRKLSAR